MIKDGLLKFNIESSNLHLLNIYTNNSSFLELGSIDYNILQRLLNYEIIAYEDLVYFPTQFVGIGRSQVSDEELRKTLPVLFFERLNQKNKNVQVFITYGLLRLKDEDNNEIFSPLVLIPVTIYFENDRIFIQQISRPIENSVVLKYLAKTKKIDIPLTDKLDTAYAIDRYCLSFEKFFGKVLVLENFLTFASLKDYENKIERNIFKNDKLYPDYLRNELYNNEYPHLYYSRPLNRMQRLAVYKASEDQNILITGRLGTGKTTVLFDIAVNAILAGKRVLYLSNMKETLIKIYKLFEEKGLNRYVTDFSNSFASFHQSENYPPLEVVEEEEIDFDYLLQNYRYINNYIEVFTSRVLDFRFVDIVSELAIIADEQKEFIEIDDLSSIYKAEYLEIVRALTSIESNLIKIGNFRASIWKEIPIFNNIKYPNQVFSLIHQVQKNYQVFEDERAILENEYGFKTIKNYAHLKSLIHDFEGLNITAFPYSWLDSSAFESAVEEYRNLKAKIYQIQELEYLLNFRYLHPEDIKINEEVKCLFGPYFTDTDLDKLDRISVDREKLTSVINKALSLSKLFQKSYNKVSQLLNWEFEKCNRVLDEILKLNDLVQEVKYSIKFIKTFTENKYQEVYKKAQTTLKEVTQANEQIKLLFPDFGKKENLDKNIENFEKFVQEQPLKRSAQRLFLNIQKNKPEEYKVLLENLKEYQKLKSLILEKEKEFEFLTGFACDEEVLVHLEQFNRVLSSIDDKLIKSKFIRFLKNTLNPKEHETKSKRNHLIVLEQFSSTYRRINKHYETLMNYKFGTSQIEFLDRLKDIVQIANYLDNRFASNDRLMEIKKFHEHDYVPAEEYLNMFKNINGVTNGILELENNKHYHYLYGKLYEGYETNLNNISRFLQAYRLYSECFRELDFLIDSLNSDKHEQIKVHLENCKRGNDALIEVFKLYFKVFKDSVSTYYYSSFASILDFLEELIKAKDELIIYLAITENIQILHKYNLEILINYIIDLESPRNICRNFQYTYLSSIKNTFLKKYPYLSNYRALESCLETVMVSEKKIIEKIEKQTFSKIYQQCSTKFNVLGVKNLDYSAFIRKTSNLKRLFLANTQVFNTFLDLKDFDLVIIDNAHLLDASRYSRALSGSQVVVAGEYQLQSLVAYNLISRIASSKDIHFNFRFLPTPQSLLNQMQGLQGLTYDNYQDNFGLEINNKKLSDQVVTLFLENRDYKINLFLKNLDLQKQIYDEIANLLLGGGFTSKEIIKVVQENLNICDLELGYVFDADFNILYLEDYYQVDSEFLVVNMIDNLLLCRKKLVIQDGNERLKSSLESRFLVELKKVVDNQEVYLPAKGSELIMKIINYFEEAGLTTYHSTNYSFLVRKSDRLYAVVLYCDNQRADFELLNNYRNNYFNSKFIKIYSIWMMEILDSVKTRVQEIIEDIIND